MRRTYTMLFIAAALCVFAHGAWAWDLPLDIDLIKVHFDHNIDSTASDGITIQKNKTTITAPEYYPAASKYDECAYLMSVTAPTVKAEFYAYDLWQGYSNVSVITDSTDVWRLSESTMTFQPSGASGMVSFNTNANYQQTGSVGKYPFSWSWMVTKIDGDPVTPFKIGKSGHVMYNVLDTPNAPMDTTWVEVLDYACDWAQGETTATGAAEEITKGIYEDLGFIYYRSIYDNGPRYGSQQSGTFNLTTFLQDIGYGQYVVCYDMGQALVIFGNAVGCDMTYRMSNKYTCYCFGYLNCVLPIGHDDWTNNPFYGQGSWFDIKIMEKDSRVGRSYFLNHAFAAIGDAFYPQYVYDACMKVDSDNIPDYSPCVESWLTGDNWDDRGNSGNYNQKVIDCDPVHDDPTGPAEAFSFTVY